MTEIFMPEPNMQLVRDVRERREGRTQTSDGPLLDELADALESAAAALTAVSAELDRERAVSKPHRPSARAWASIVERAEDAETDRDRLHKAITEARKLNDRAQRDPDIWEDMERILRAALDKEGNDDE